MEKESPKDMVGIGADEAGSLLARLPNFPEFTDLKSVTDGNGVEYLYSVSEMTNRYMEILFVSFITVRLVWILCDMLWPASDVRLTWLQA